MKDFYNFPAIFSVAEDGISIRFPDLPGCFPCADNFEEAFKNAKEAMQLHLFGMEEDSENIPAPTSIANIHPAESETLVMIEAWMPPFREKMNNKATNKTVTIPRWLDELARHEKVNYSRLLQEALKIHLGLQVTPSHLTSPHV